MKYTQYTPKCAFQLEHMYIVSSTIKLWGIALVFGRYYFWTKTTSKSISWRIILWELQVVLKTRVNTFNAFPSWDNLMYKWITAQLLPPFLIRGLIMQYQKPSK
jgi:thiosulfate reductase cytochrome b subunit